MSSEHLYYDGNSDVYLSVDKPKSKQEAPWKLITEIIKRSEAATWEQNLLHGESRELVYVDTSL
jgi:hypothetical protein